jgi:thioredoxin reductase (NADPH)
MSSFDVFVIGAGVAGLSAAEQAVRRGWSVCIAEELMFGGLVLNVNHLAPGLPDLPGSGSELCAELMTRLTDLGVEMLFEPVSALEPAADGTLKVTTTSGQHAARSVVVASGAQLRKLGVPGEEEFEHRGVAHCADCDAPLYRGEVAVVVGGGDSALQEALVLAEFCSAVHLVHRGSAFGGRSELADAVRGAQNVQVHLGTAVEAILGEQQVTAVRVRELASGATRELPCKGIFSYVGLEPNTAFLPAAIETEGQAIRVDGRMESTLPGVYAVGAVRAGYAGQLTDAVRDATTAVQAMGERLRQR